jgi:hypothetical protein
MEQGYGDEPPTDDQHGVSHVRGAALDDQINDEQKTERCGNDQRNRNDLTPCSYVFCFRVMTAFIIFYQKFLPTPIRKETSMRAYQLLMRRFYLCYKAISASVI